MSCLYYLGTWDGVFLLLGHTLSTDDGSCRPNLCCTHEEKESMPDPVKPLLTLILRASGQVALAAGTMPAFMHLVDPDTLRLMPCFGLLLVLGAMLSVVVMYTLRSPRLLG